MDPAVLAAAEINALWADAIDGQKIDNPKVPSNEKVAEIIRKYLTTEK